MIKPGLSTIALDIGSTSIKGALIEPDSGVLVRCIKRPFPDPLSNLPAGHVEVDPNAVVQAVRSVLLELSEQSSGHCSVWVCGQMGGVVLAFPYIFYQLWAFIKPGLKGNEKNMAKGIVFYVSLLFFLGILFGYYIVAPLSVQFFGAFQITPEIKTDVTIASYMSTILSTVFYTGLFFLFPIVTFLLVKIGLFTPDFLIKYRKHAIVVILILAAVITPPDVISQVIVTIPIYLLFEVSILVAKRVVKKEQN